jgi:hypothetical protein
MLARLSPPRVVEFGVLSVGNTFVRAQKGSNDDIFLKMKELQDGCVTRNALKLDDCSAWSFQDEDEVVVVETKEPIYFSPKL